MEHLSSKNKAAILKDPIQYIEIPLGADFFFNEYQNVMNDQHET